LTTTTLIILKKGEVKMKPKWWFMAMATSMNAGFWISIVLAAKPMIIDRVGFGGIQDWQHDLGRTCFETIIDPEIFKSINKF